MESSTVLFWGMIFSSIGIGYFLYGKKTGVITYLILGIALFIYPFFITELYWLIGIGTLLTLLPFFIRR